MTDKKVDEDWKKRAQQEKSVEWPKEANPSSSQIPEREILGPPDFLQFVSSLAAQALVHLGAIPNPMTGERTPDLDHARYTIDIIEMLQEKTRGNRTPDESEHLERLLTELRLAYVDATSPRPKK